MCERVEYAALRAEAANASTDDQALVSRPELRHLLASYDELTAAVAAKRKRRAKGTSDGG